jgi:hypothetical protein
MLHRWRVKRPNVWTAGEDTSRASLDQRLDSSSRIGGTGRFLPLSCRAVHAVSLRAEGASWMGSMQMASSMKQDEM